MRPSASMRIRLRAATAEPGRPGGVVEGRPAFPPACAGVMRAAGAMAAAVAAGFVHAAAAQTLELRYGQAYSSAHSIFSLPIAGAERERLVVREGLNVRVIVPIPGGSDKMIAALHDDWVDVTHVAT